jgi:hypothetical protein
MFSVALWLGRLNFRIRLLGILNIVEEKERMKDERTSRLDTYDYQCQVLDDVTQIDTTVTTGIEEQESAYPFIKSSYQMTCHSLHRCGIMSLTGNGSPSYAWYNCPALATLKETGALPNPRRNVNGSL